jgi:hypothetical protein
MGFIEETGAGQYYRDARILPIYEGTNGIQALDLLGRKLTRDKGETANVFIQEMKGILVPLKALDDVNATAIAKSLGEALDILGNTSQWLIETAGQDINHAASGATPYLDLFSITVGGWIMAQRFLAAKNDLSMADQDTAFLEAQCITARFYADNILPRATGLAASVTAGGLTVMSLSEEQF